MTKLEIIQKRYSVKSEEELTEEQLTEFALSEDAGLCTNVSMKDVIDLYMTHRNDTYYQPDMNRVYGCLRESIRRNASFRFGIIEESNELYSYRVG